ncbi:hypothetical protein E3N88_06401 [Mikania micrantha]|uniref:Uncharacterized protein n=1 Tax=Mikania micrantha TaxID=192012 RepID=A0A5N6PQM1_9ASTR|nr:hypothetical protein E3N88_06401 [Mikania micrantha]
MGGPGWEGMVVVDGGGAVVDVGGAGGEGDRAEVGKKKGGVGKKKGWNNRALPKARVFTWQLRTQDE